MLRFVLIDGTRDAGRMLRRKIRRMLLELGIAENFLFNALSPSLARRYSVGV